jgi:dihydroxyacetone kinase-like predicted kinase
VFAAAGEVSHLDVADMHALVQQRIRGGGGAGGGLPEREGAEGHDCCGVLAVATGAGLHELFRSVGAHVLDGGPTLNPSTAELLSGIHDVPAEEVVVLPNSPNVIMAAERAAELSEKVVLVVPATSQQAGLGAAVALNAARPAADNAAAMREALDELRTGAVAPAARDDREGRFTVGEAVGFVEDELVAWGEPQATLRAVLDRLADGAELITCIAGEGAPLDPGAVSELAPDGVELELSAGGQPSYWWLLSAE